MTVATEQLRSIVDRILRLKEEQDTLGDDIRDVYAEANSNGFNKTALGQLITRLRKQSKDPAKFEEQSALFDLYLSAYEGREKPAALAPARACVENIEEIRTESGKTAPTEKPESVGLKPPLESPSCARGSDESAPQESRLDQTAESTAARNDAGKTGVTAGRIPAPPTDHDLTIPEFLRRDAVETSV